MASPNLSSSPVISLDRVREHKFSNDCWIVVHSKVYDVTSFLPEHPGGSKIILKYAGSDATTAYDEIHAPGILEETLPQDRFVGMLSLEDVETLSAATKGAVTDTDKISKDITSTRPATTLEPYTKPELHKLISAHDFEEVAKHTFTTKAFAFYSSAATDLVTHGWNSDFYRKIMIRPRVLRNVKNVQIKRKILGCDSEAPFFVSPAAMARLAHPDGECSLAKGCAGEGIIQIISSNASYPLGAITSSGSPNQPFFLQLYVNSDRSKTFDLLKKARGIGIKAIFVTVDAPVPGKREADERVAAENVASAISGAEATNDKKGGGMGRLMAQYIDSTLSWEDLTWIRETSGLPVVLKGVQSAVDVRKAVEYGVDGVLLSNHGGRSLDTSQPAILTLLELHKYAPEVFGQLEIYVDGGITRGTDIMKALALGATSVGIGRPYIYALAYGEAGVQHLTEILKDELQTAMKLCGVTDVDLLHPGLLNTSMIDELVADSNKHAYITWKPKAML